ncbi:unnamed protein product, partial [Brenthis ino]
MSFTGFSEEDLRRIKSSESTPNTDPQKVLAPKKYNTLFGNSRAAPVLNRQLQQKNQLFNKQGSEDSFHKAFDKCKLSLKSPTLQPEIDNVITSENVNEQVDNNEVAVLNAKTYEENGNVISTNENVLESTLTDSNLNISSRKNSASVTPDVVKCVDNYTEDELATHRIKLEQLQLQQKLMEEQNKKRKEMLAKALADRTKQTEEEVQKLEKIKKELQIMDGQFSQDVSVLRKKIDQACSSYAEAEKHYLKVEKEFLQAKISLQKEKEKKELLTEHLCALITHNETRKAQKLETLMLELASDKKKDIPNVPIDDEEPIVIHGVDERTGKIMEIVPQS